MKRYFAVAAILIATSCTNNTNQKVVLSAPDSSAAVAADPGTAASIKLKDANIQSIYNSYITLKDALVSTKFEEAAKAAAALKINLANKKGCESTALIADKIAAAKDIAAQRKDFTALSTDLIALFKHADLEAGTIYVQHCPMANKGDGGDWLSSEQKIQNPYYGDEMMECGRVAEEIKSAK